MTVKDLVSIIIPAYNAAAFINDAIESALAQDYRPIEVIVVDDGSSDETACIAERFGPPVICHRQQNGGPAVARNRGLLLARGEYIGFLDADDLYEPGRVKLQFNKLQQNPGLTIVMGRLKREQLDSEPGEPITFKPMESDDFICLQLGLCLFRRTVFERVGVMEESLRHSDDWDWFMRARELQVPMLLHDDIVLRARLHWNNMTRDRKAHMHFLPIMLKRSIDRRRAIEKGRPRSLAKLAMYRETTKPKDGGGK
jgi:glycosyltransferase involved in cell wall biosynthesis